MMNTLISQTAGRNINFEITSDMIIRADRRLITIALENLLGNAVKFTANVLIAKIEIGCSDQAGEKEFFVRDNGAGFDMAYVHKLFTPFQRLHNDREFPGTGIGLSIVQRIITRHGGRMRVEAAVNEGATFYFTLGGVKDERFIR
jgi:light-regulated signal transduction histidine kinase (bacteriophytochrome)